MYLTTEMVCICKECKYIYYFYNSNAYKDILAEFHANLNIN